MLLIRFSLSFFQMQIYVPTVHKLIFQSRYCPLSGLLCMLIERYIKKLNHVIYDELIILKSIHIYLSNIFLRIIFMYLQYKNLFFNLVILHFLDCYVCLLKSISTNLTMHIWWLYYSKGYHTICIKHILMPNL